MLNIKFDNLTIYKDDAIWVVSKPAGISVTPEGWDKDQPCMHHLLRQNDPGLLIVHRLDKDTSGVMVFARNAEAHRNLSLQFENHQVSKTYLALVYGVPQWKETTARHRLRIGVGKKHRTMVDHTHGLNAETGFTVKETFSEYALLSAVPKTGRTHQIRVHLYAKGHPIVGDPLYGEGSTEMIDRVALHASELEFTHPTTGILVRFECPLPEDFTTALKKIKKPAAE